MSQKNGIINKESSSHSKRKGGDIMSKLDVIRKYWGKISYAEIGKMTGQSADAVRKMGRKDGLEPVKRNAQNLELTPEDEIEKDAKVSSLSKGKTKAETKYKIVTSRLEEAEKIIEAMKAVGSANSYTIKSKDSDGRSEATAVIVASDWHYEETVHSENVNGMNEYNTDIAKVRAELFFVNAVKLIKIFKKESEINTLVLAFLGDLINGQLREEAMENNSLQPVDACIEVSKVIIAGIKYILANTDLKLVIPCHSGNHGRTTKTVHISTEAGNSHEYGMYHGVASAFEGNTRVQFIIPRSYHSFIDINGYVIRFQHGHAMKYAGGVGGIYISVNKAIAQWNKVRHADLDVFGHFHQLRDGGNFICNGSLIGWNEFANFIKADFEKPKQAFFLIDHKRKVKSVTAPIFLE